MKKLTTDIFIERADIKHDHKYDYSLVKYVKSKIQVKIICKIHGIFKQTPNDHLSGKGCYKCGREITAAKNLSNTDNFKTKADIKHDFKYDYSLANYKQASIQVKIICKKHGVFKQTPQDHLSGKGCYKCGREQAKTKLFSNAEKFNNKADKVHDRKYDYSLVQYVDSYIEVEIICPRHGIFKQIPNSHLNGHGCPECTNLISKPETIWLNSLNLPNDPDHRQARIKIGKKTFKVDGFDPTTNTIYEFNGDYYHGNPAKYPPDQINPTSKKTYGELYARTLVKEALLKSAGYKVISIWESDFKASLDKTVKK